MKKIVIALEGNPNVGKSTLFNQLTGMQQHVGNWPGKTVEKKEGGFKKLGESFKTVDLPGTYSLTAFTDEELVARNFVIEEKPDVVINIIDATCLERNLYLTFQTLELTSKVVIALNMTKTAKKRGIIIDAAALSKILGVPVVPIEAIDGTGVDKLIETTLRVAKGKTKNKPRKVDFGKHMEEQIRAIQKSFGKKAFKGYDTRWLAIKLMENDEEVVNFLKEKGMTKPLEKNKEIEESEVHHDSELEIADKRYEQINRIANEVMKKKGNGADFTQKVDRLVTNKWLGIPLLLLIFTAVFWLTFNVSAPMMDLIDQGVSLLSGSAGKALSGAPELVSSLIVDGIIAGVGGVLVFLPLIAVFFIVFALLEDTGYMARAAFVMDRLMHAIGLEGRSFLCMVLGYGCNVPAIMATRTLKDKKDKLLTILLNPLIPCEARLGVTAFIVGIFFTGPKAALVMSSLFILNITLLVAFSYIFKTIILPGQHPTFIMELPPYRLPSAKNLLLHAWERVNAFLKRAGTLIFLVSIIIWFLSNFPTSDPLEASLAGMVGRALEPIGKVVGFDWKIIISLLFGFAAKELTISSLGILYGFEEGMGLSAVLRSAWTPLSAYTFLIFQMVYVPCLATVAVIKKETGSWKWTAFSIAYSLLAAFVISVVVYNISTQIGV